LRGASIFSIRSGLKSDDDLIAALDSPIVLDAKLFRPAFDHCQVVVVVAPSVRKFGSGSLDKFVAEGLELGESLFVTSEPSVDHHRASDVMEGVPTSVRPGQPVRIRISHTKSVFPGNASGLKLPNGRRS
jgi:hypothetical protein